MWQPATTLAPAQLPGDAALALDAKGDALAVWERFDQAFSDTGVVLASYRQAGSDGWQPPVPIGPAGPWDPEVAFDGGGNATAVWISHASDNSSQPLLSATRSAATGRWSRPDPVSPSEAFAYEQPALGVDAMGDAVVAWGGEVAYRTAGAGWQTPTRPFDAQQWQVTMASDGSMLLVGFVVIGGYPNFANIEADIGYRGSWAGPVKLGTTSEYAPPVGAIAPAGNAVVSWGTNEHGNDIVYAATRVAGAWQTAAPISFLDGNAGGPKVGIDDRGDMLAIWNATVDPESSLRPAGSSVWQRPVAVAPPIQYTQPTLAMNGAGQAVAAWTTYTSDALISAAWFTAGTGWESAQAIGGQGLYSVSGTVPVAIDAAGDAIAVWQHYESTNAGSDYVTLKSAILDNGGPLLHAVFNHARPRLSGDARVGRKLRCDAGEWTGQAPIRFAFRWLRSAHAVAYARSYRVVRGDAGRLLACRVTATNTFGSVAATSRPVRVRR